MGGPDERHEDDAQSMAINGNQWQSMANNGKQWQLKATRPQSDRNQTAIRSRTHQTSGTTTMPALIEPRRIVVDVLATTVARR